MTNPEAVGGLGLRWLEADGPDADIVLSTRVRLARNLQGHRFASRTDTDERRRICDRVARLVDGSSLPEGARFLAMEGLEAHSRRILLERRLVSHDLVGRVDGVEPAGAALLAWPDAPVSAMVNEEDHLRLQCLVSGLSVVDAWSLVDRLDVGLGSELPLAFHHDFGYLTSCPTNAGTGLRASALVHLPALVLTKEIGRVLEGLGRLGLTHRGVDGEGSQFTGNFFQLSNQTTLGRSEEDLIEHFGRTVDRVVEKERDARQVLLHAGPRMEDLIWRAYGLLRHARLLGDRDFSELLSGVRLGVSLRVLRAPAIGSLNRMMVFAQAAHLDEAAGHPLSAEERRCHRAEYVRAALRDPGKAPTSDAAP